jgi:histidyl-tRNA synthetase
MDKKNKLTPGLPSGFEDRWSDKLSLKKNLIKIIEDNFIRYGFSPLETPSFEISENIGSFLVDDKDNPMSDVFTYDDNSKKITLRYDLSSPLARFVAQNYLELSFPYKRYQIGNVWRNEKSGNARYREFTQADCDIVGNFEASFANVELLKLIADILIECGLSKDQFKINISNRKIVQGLINQLKIKDKNQELKVIRAIDKLDRVGLKGVEALLKKERIDEESGAITKGANLSNDQAAEILNFLKIKDINKLKLVLNNSLSIEGMKEIEKILEILTSQNCKNLVQTNFTIVRGLAYYDGFCVETNLNFKVKNSKGKPIDIGSVCSGGQYGNLISRFKGVDYAGTGISFGVDRLLYAMLQIDKIEIGEKKPVLICVMEQKYLDKYFELLKILRKNKINSEIFLDPSKNMGKQLTYANKRGCPVAVICGENEFKEGTVTLKNLLATKGENNQVTIKIENFINEVKKFI